MDEVDEEMEEVVAEVAAEMVAEVEVVDGGRGGGFLVNLKTICLFQSLTTIIQFLVQLSEIIIQS